MPSLLPVYIYFSVLKLPRTSAAVPSLLILWKQSIDLPLCSTENVQVTSVANQFSFNLTNFDDPQAFLFSSILLPQLLLAFQSSSSSSNRVMPPSFLLSAQPETGAAKRGARRQRSRQRARLAWTSRLLQCDGADCIGETQPRLLLWALFPFAVSPRRRHSRACPCIAPQSSGRDAETLCSAPPVDGDVEGVSIIFAPDSSSCTSSRPAPAAQGRERRWCR